MNDIEANATFPGGYPLGLPVSIKVAYRSCDGCRMVRTFKTLKGAQRFAHKYVGTHPEIGRYYAISGDGVGKVMVDGATLAELFPSRD